MFYVTHLSFHRVSQYVSIFLVNKINNKILFLYVYKTVIMIFKVERSCLDCFAFGDDCCCHWIDCDLELSFVYKLLVFSVTMCSNSIFPPLKNMYSFFYNEFFWQWSFSVIMLKTSCNIGKIKRQSQSFMHFCIHCSTKSSAITFGQPLYSSS